MILDGGPVGIGIESTIIDLTEDKPMVLRPGYITPELSQTSLAASPIMRSTRSRISVAALLVKVMARMLYGATPYAKRFAMRQVSTFVLPEPAPAMMSSGPSVCATAFFCAGFKPLKISKVSSNRFSLLHGFWFYR